MKAMILFKGKITIESLVNYMNGSVSESENEEIRLWIESGKENAEFFNRLREIWENQEDIESLLRENRNSDWEKVLQGLKRKDLSVKSAKKITMRWQRIAVAVLLLFFTALGYYSGQIQYPKPIVFNNSLYHEIIVPVGEKSELKFSDGTIMWINAGSRVRFPNAFNTESREIWLDGEAYFEVARDKNRPFIVHTSDVNVKVLGTKFNLKAYDDEDIFEATLIEGLVSLETRNILGNNGDEVFLKPHHKAIYLKKNTRNITNDIAQVVNEPLKPRKIIISNPVKVESSISWREGKLQFNDETLENIAIKLERRYGVEIKLEGKEMKEVKYSGVLKNISVEQALKAIQMTTEFTYVIDDNIVTIKSKEKKDKNHN